MCADLWIAHKAALQCLKINVKNLNKKDNKQKMSLARCLMGIHMNKMDGSSTYSQPLGRMYRASGITSTSTISTQHLNYLVDGSQVTRHLHSSVAGARQRKQVGIAGNLANLSPYKVLQISHVPKSCKSLALRLKTLV